MSSYVTVKIPSELAARLDGLATDLGYHSRAEIVNDAVRRFIDERKRLESTPVPLEIH
ncbi:MAG: ribbon-helix-helix domain-containing protein [Nitrososphaerales archaeon]